MGRIHITVYESYRYSFQSFLAEESSCRTHSFCVEVPNYGTVSPNALIHLTPIPAWRERFRLIP
jgi:hypothetical protein